MNTDTLLDAFGLIDDRFLDCVQTPRVIPWRRRIAVLIAAVLLISMCIGTVMAVSEDFRSFIFSVFRIETPEQPPVHGETHPTQPILQEDGIVNIDGQVNAWYFSSGGFVAVHDGGFYTSQWPENGTAPAEPAFWEITFNGIAEVPSTRVDIPFTHGGKTFRILFDYAVLNNSLAIRVWPEGLNENPVGNGWNLEPMEGRTDTALLTIPVLRGADYSHDLFLLDLTTLEITELVVNCSVSADGYRLSGDLRYAILSGIDGQWLFDLDTGVMRTLNGVAPHFLDAETVLFRRYREDGSFDLIRMNVQTGTETAVLEQLNSDNYRPIQYHWADGRHGLLLENGVNLVDFRTGERMGLTGLSPENLVCDESPDGSRVMLGYEEENGFTALGILDTGSGVLKLLERQVSGGSESFRGWLDNDTLVITAHDIPDAELDFTQGDGYYVYVYRFLDPER